MNTIIVPPAAAGNRLDKFLAGETAGRSRSELQKTIKNRGVLINGRPAMTPHAPVKAGDRIDLIEPAATPGRPPARPAEVKVAIIAACPDYLVADKPAGLVVHAAVGDDRPSLARIMRARFPEIAAVGEDPERPGIVHRLDREVSGLIIIARTPSAYRHFKKQFQARRVAKRYFALVHGAIARDEGVIDFPLARSARSGKTAARPKTTKGQEAICGREAVTVFRVKKRWINFAGLEVEIKTGRTHQIRAHLAAYGHPIAGDRLYGTSKTRARDAKLALDGIGLAAVYLAFSGPDGRPQEYRLPVPARIRKVMAVIK